MLDLRQLRYFAVLAEELNFGRAAERIGIAQPPLSKQIAAMERQLGVVLFHRTKRKVSLSEAGLALLPAARRILADVAHAESAAQQAGRGEAGNLRLGYTGVTVFARMLSDLIRRYRRHYPGVSVSLVELHTVEQLTALVEGRIDLGFVRLPLVDPDERIAVRELYAEPLIAALPVGHPAARYSRVPLASLAAEPFIVFPRGVTPGFFDTVIAACREAGFSPRVVQEAAQFTSLVGLVAAGLGVALVPRGLDRLKLDGVVYRPVSGTRALAPVGLAMRRGDPAPAVQTFARMADG
jgi:DNA-binding transcriptional LysR family regulator